MNICSLWEGEKTVRIKKILVEDYREEVLVIEEDVGPVDGFGGKHRRDAWCFVYREMEERWKISSENWLDQRLKSEAVESKDLYHSIGPHSLVPKFLHSGNGIGNKPT